MTDKTDLHRLIISVQDDKKVIKQKESYRPQVGLFYVVGETLYCEGVDTENGTDSGHFKIFSKMHPTYWQDIIIQKEPELGKHDVYHFPRGRVVFDCDSRRYELVADQCIIENKEMMARIVEEMKLPKNQVIVSTDIHYTCHECKERILK